MTIRLYDRIVVKGIEEEQRMQGVLHIPDSAKGKPKDSGEYTRHTHLVPYQRPHRVQ